MTFQKIKLVVIDGTPFAKTFLQSSALRSGKHWYVVDENNFQTLWRLGEDTVKQYIHICIGLMSRSEKFWPNSCFNNYLESGELLWNSVSLLICQSRMVDEKVIPILFYFSFNKLRWWDYHWQQHQTCQLYSSFHLITLTLMIWSTMLCILWLSTNSKSI